MSKVIKVIGIIIGAIGVIAGTVIGIIGIIALTRKEDKEELDYDLTSDGIYF